MRGPGCSGDSPRPCALLDRGFTVATGEVTPSLKLKRQIIAERYRDLIEEMYQEK